MGLAEAGLLCCCCRGAGAAIVCAEAPSFGTGHLRSVMSVTVGTWMARGCSLAVLNSSVRTNLFLLMEHRFIPLCGTRKQSVATYGYVTKTSVVEEAFFPFFFGVNMFAICE